MKKLFILAAVFFMFSCDNTRRNENTHRDHTTEESINEGSGTNISPQLKDSDRNNNRLEVDTTSVIQDAP